MATIAEVIANLQALPNQNDQFQLSDVVPNTLAEKPQFWKVTMNNGAIVIIKSFNPVVQISARRLDINNNTNIRFPIVIASLEGPLRSTELGIPLPQ